MTTDRAHQIAAVFAAAEDLAGQARAAYAEVDALLARWRAAGGTYDEIAAAIIESTGREPTADEMRRVVDVLRQRHRRRRLHDSCHTPTRDSGADRRHGRCMPESREPVLVERVTERTVERYAPLDDLADSDLSRPVSSPTSVPIATTTANSPSVSTSTETEGE